MSVPSAVQAGVEYVGAIAKSAANAFQSFTHRISSAVAADPWLVLAAISVVLLVIWWTRPRSN